MKRQTFLITIGILYALILRGNDQRVAMREFQYAPTSPTASQFGRYDHLPISEYTGNPQVSIPLYSRTMDDLDLSLILSYQPGGIKVNQQATWVGLGWDLSFGAVVQMINDIDDLATGSVNSGFVNGKKKYLPPWLETSRSTSYAYEVHPLPVYSNYSATCIPEHTVAPVGTTPKDTYSIWLMVHGYWNINNVWQQHHEMYYQNDGQLCYDTEPDIFKINLLGETLNIVYNFQTNTPVVLNKKGYTVRYTTSTNTWTVNTPERHTYYFTTCSETETAVYVNINNAGGPGSLPKISMRTWLLDKITTKYGKEIKFHYQRSTQRVETFTRRQSQDRSYGHRQTGLGGSQMECGLCGPEVLSSYLYNYDNYDREYPYVLTKISTPMGDISFTTSGRQDIPGTYKLDKITLFTTNGVRRDWVSFNYDYFTEKRGGGKRLKLNSVTVKDEKYTFSYNSTALPPRNAYEQDYWGYPNGVTQNTSLIPNPARFKTAYSSLDNGNNMSAHLTYTKSAVLEGVTYPTGGRVRFEYELHQFSGYWVPDRDSLNNKVSKGNGLRVRSVQYRDHDGTTSKQTQYRYAGGKAMLRHMPVMEFNGIEYTSAYRYDAKVVSCSSGGYYTQNPLSSFSGIGYDKVVRYESSVNEKKMRTETFYYNNPDLYPKQTSTDLNVRAFTSLPSIKNPSYPENGKIRSVCYYNDSNQVVKQMDYTYQNARSTRYYGARVASMGYYYIRKQIIAGGYDIRKAPVHSVGFYPIFDFETLLTKEVMTEYYGGKPLQTISEYTYDEENRLATRKVTGNSSTETYHSEKYIYDSYWTREPSSITMSSGKTGVVSQEWKQVNGRPLPYQKSVTVSVPFHVNQQWVTTYDLYNSHRNLRQKTDPDGLVTTYLWGYYQQYLIAEIKNATYEQVVDALGGESYVTSMENQTTNNPHWVLLNNLRQKLPDAHITTCEYIPLVGMSQYVDSNGLVTYYTYNDAYRLTEVYRMENGQKQVVEQYDYHFK